MLIKRGTHPHTFMFQLTSKADLPQTNTLIIFTSHLMFRGLALSCIFYTPFLLTEETFAKISITLQWSVGGVSKGFLLVRQTQSPTQLQLQMFLLFIPHYIIMVYFLHWHLEIYEASELMDEWTNSLKDLLLP